MGQVQQNRLGTYRKLAGLTQSDAAYIFGISRSELGCYEKGLRSPSLEFAADSSDFYRAPITDIFPATFNCARPWRTRRLQTLASRFRAQSKKDRLKPDHAFALQWIEQRLGKTPNV